MLASTKMSTGPLGGLWSLLYRFFLVLSLRPLQIHWALSQAFNRAPGGCGKFWIIPHAEGWEDTQGNSPGLLSLALACRRSYSLCETMLGWGGGDHLPELLYGNEVAFLASEIPPTPFLKVISVPFSAWPWGWMEGRDHVGAWDLLLRAPTTNT